VSLGVVFPLILILGIITFIDYIRMRDAMLSNLSLLASQSGQLIEDNLRQQMLKQDFTSMQEMLDTVSVSQNFRALYLLDTSGRIIFSPGDKNVGQKLDNTQPGCQPCHALPVAKRPSSIVISTAGGESVFRSMEPIENSPPCDKCHDPIQRNIGLLLIDIPTAPLESSIGGALRDNLILWISTILAVLIVVNLALNRFVLARLEGFVSIIRKMGSGQKLPQLPIQEADEIGNLAQAYNDMARQVEVRQAEIADLSNNLLRQSTQRGELLKRLISAQEDERRRIARELHDELGQSISGLALRVEVIQRLLSSNPERASDQLDQVKNLIVDTSNQMYDLILALRPSVLDDLGLAAALRAFETRLFGDVAIEFVLDDTQFTERLPQEIETLLYRIFQEAITNVFRHSRATQLSISLAKNRDGFVGKVADNGMGFDLAAFQNNGDNRRGLGLLGMQERIAQCGGELKIETSPGHGTIIQIQIPLEGITNG
jgi:signal transduction histidine kinase